MPKNHEMIVQLQFDMDYLSTWQTNNPGNNDIGEFFTEQSKFIQRMMILKNDLSQIKANLPKKAIKDKQLIAAYEKDLSKLLDAYYKMDFFSPIKATSSTPQFKDFKKKIDYSSTYATTEEIKKDIIEKFIKNKDYSLLAQKIAVSRPKLLDVLKNTAFEQRTLNRCINRATSFAYEPEIRITTQFKQLDPKISGKLTNSLIKAKNDLLVQKLAREEMRAAGNNPALKKEITLRAILDLNMNNPSMQKTGPKVSSFDAYLKVLLTEAYPDLFKLNKSGDLSYTDSQFKIAFGDDLNKSFKLDPKRFNFSSLLDNKDKRNYPLFAVLYSTQPLSPVDKVDAYKQVASVIYSKRMSDGQDRTNDLFNIAISARAITDQDPNAKTRFKKYFEKDPDIQNETVFERFINTHTIGRIIGNNCKKGQFGDWLATKDPSLYDALSKAKNEALPDLKQNHLLRTLNDFIPVHDSSPLIKPNTSSETEIGRPEKLSVNDMVESGFEHPNLSSLALAFKDKFDKSNSTGIKQIITEFVHIANQRHLSHTEQLGILTDTMKDIVTKRRDWKVEFFWSNRSLFGVGRGKEAKEMYEYISDSKFDLTNKSQFNAFMSKYAGMNCEALAQETISPPKL